MSEPEELDSLERVRRQLYSTGGPTASVEPPPLSLRTPSAATGWQKVAVSAKQKTGLSGPVLFLIIAALFFVLAVGVAAYLLIFGGRAVSNNNIVITAQGPTTIGSGDTVPLLITIENKNPVTITNTKLTVQFPDGTRSPDDITKDLARFDGEPGDIPAGGVNQQTVRAVIFGSENQKVSLPIRFEYRTPDSNSVFVKEKTYDFTITTSPLSVTVNTLSQVSSGQSVTVIAKVRSNATTPIQNAAVEVTYPFGFAPSAVDPKPVSGGLFTFGTLAPGEEKTITITGVLTGENNDERIFKFNAGVLKSADLQVLGVSYTTQQATIKLTRPFLATTLTIDGDTGESPVIRSGTTIQNLVSWVNTLSTQVQDGRIVVSLSGDVLDKESVATSNGFYQSSNGSIVFDSTMQPLLATLQPGDTGRGTFSFSTKIGSGLSSLRNPTIKAVVSVSGRRVGEAGVPESVSSTITRTIKVGTTLALASKAVRTVGPFTNTGPWPPAADQESTYTVVYALTNDVNSVGGASVTATLPSYVRFLGKTSPADGTLTYNETTRQVTWAAGDVPAGTTSTAPRTIAFQIALLPSLSQRGTSPVLLSEQKVTAVDRFTQKQIVGMVPQLTTQVSEDPAFSFGLGSVQ